MARMATVVQMKEWQESHAPGNRRKIKFGPPVMRIAKFMIDRYNQIGYERRALAKQRMRLEKELDMLLAEDARLATKQRKLYERKEYAETKNTLGWIKWEFSRIFLPY